MNRRFERIPAWSVPLLLLLWAFGLAMCVELQVWRWWL